MKYAGIIKNDITAAPGVCVSFFTQGCPHRCAGCHNPETWDFEGGKEFTSETLEDIYQSLIANGVHRNLCIMGGEPLCSENQFLTLLVIQTIKDRLPDVKIYIWTGYYYENIPDSNRFQEILKYTDYIIDGPYIQEQRDIALNMRGSTNQSIINIKENTAKI